MESDWESDEGIFRGLRHGHNGAVAAFCRRYGEIIERLADRHMPGALRRRLGAEDIAQSVCRTFVRRAAEGEFELPDGGSLWGLLCAITVTKVREETRFHLRQKRGMNREQHLDSVTSAGVPKVPEPSVQATPGEAAEFADQFERLVSAFDEEERQVIQLRLQDYTLEEIAERLECSERTIRRFLKRVQERLSGMLARDLAQEAE